MGECKREGRESERESLCVCVSVWVCGVVYEKEKERKKLVSWTNMVSVSVRVWLCFCLCWREREREREREKTWVRLLWVFRSTSSSPAKGTSTSKQPNLKTDPNRKNDFFLSWAKMQRHRRRRRHRRLIIIHAFILTLMISPTFEAEVTGDELLSQWRK